MLRLIEPTEIELDKKRLMVLDHEALRFAELELNKWRHGAANAMAWQSIDEFVGTARIRALFGHYPADFAQIMLWASLKREDALLTIAAVGALITDRAYVDAKITEAMAKAWPAPKSDEPPQDDDEVKKKAGQPIGSDTGVLPAQSCN